jgi:hypothetical protein
MTNNAILGGVDLGLYVAWVNEFDYSPAKFEQLFTLSGHQIINQFTQRAGQKIQLKMDLFYPVLKAVYALGNDAMELIICDGRQFNVVIDRTNDKPIEANPAFEANAYDDDSFFRVTINLLTV